MDIFTLDAAFPPSLERSPLLAMVTVMSFWAVVLVCLQWIYEIVDANQDFPAPGNSYIAIARRVRFWLLCSGVVIAVPRLAQLMLWRILAPGPREALSAIAWIACIPCAVMVIYAWWCDKRLVATERTYVSNYGYHTAEVSTKQEKTRGAIILVLIFSVAFATTFIRPRHDPASYGNAVIQRR